MTSVHETLTCRSNSIYWTFNTKGKSEKQTHLLTRTTTVNTTSLNFYYH